MPKGRRVCVLCVWIQAKTTLRIGFVLLVVVVDGVSAAGRDSADVDLGAERDLCADPTAPGIRPRQSLPKLDEVLVIP